MAHRTLRHLFCGVAFSTCAALPAQADLKIAARPTHNVVCAAGVCTSHKAAATLNVADLETMLAGGDVTVKTDAASGSIVVVAPLTWASTHRLTLDSHDSVTVNNDVVAEGTAGVTIATNDGGSGGELSFAASYSLTFWDLTSSLIVNGSSYTLVGSIAGLAGAVASAPSGHFALAKDYDASVDGTYSAAAIPTELSGTFEGLGHTIANFALNDTGTSDYSGLFARIVGGTARDVALTGAKLQVGRQDVMMGTLVGLLGNGGIVFQSSATVKITAPHVGGGVIGGLVGDAVSATVAKSHANAAIHFSSHRGSAVGALVGALSSASLSDSTASGTVVESGTYHQSQVGGLVGQNFLGTIANCHASTAVDHGYMTGGLAGSNTGTITGSYASGNVTNAWIYAGGLVGFNTGAISLSHASGNASGLNGNVGGLVGEISSQTLGGTGGTVDRSYATGNATGPDNSSVGGLVGASDGAITNAYATGAATAGTHSSAGGLLGVNGRFYAGTSGSIAASYSTGTATAGASSIIGGSMGTMTSPATASNVYWDTDTSGISNPSQGAGNVANAPGITAQTTIQLQSGLPAGFSSAVWGSSGAVNGGLPYLLALPPS